MKYKLLELRVFAMQTLFLCMEEKMKKEQIFIDEETLTPEELEVEDSEYETEE